jgi:hypothetical protein
MSETNKPTGRWLRLDVYRQSSSKIGVELYNFLSMCERCRAMADYWFIRPDVQSAWSVRGLGIWKFRADFVQAKLRDS